MLSGRRTCRGIGRGHPLARRQRQKGEEGAQGQRRWRQGQQQCPRLCSRMTGPSSTAWRGRRRGRFSCPNGGDTEEDRGSGGGNGNDGTPDHRGSREERDDGRALPAMEVNLLDSAKRLYRCQREGGDDGTTRWQRMTTAATAVSSRNSNGQGGGRLRSGGQSTRLPVDAYQYCRTRSE